LGDGVFKILVVDDEVHLAKSAARLLQRGGHEVRALTAGADAVEALTREPFDAVVTDLEMPGVDGVQVARTARERAPTACVVMVSGCFGDRARLLEAGVCMTVDKPADYQAILDAVAECRAGRQTCARSVDGKP
jgi:DNA-binding response OmpR family regulator